MNRAEEFFQSLVVEPNSLWYKEQKKSPNSHGSYIMIGEKHSGACLAKLGRYYIFDQHDGYRHIVNSETKEVRRLPLSYKVQEAKDILSHEKFR